VAGLVKAIYVVEIGFVPNSSESRAKKQLRHAIIPNGGIQISTHVIICFFFKPEEDVVACKVYQIGDTCLPVEGI